MRIFLVLSVLFLLPVLTQAQGKAFYHITIDFYKGPDRHGSLLAVTDSGLTYRVRKRPSVVVSYSEIKDLKITRETKFGIPHVAAIAALGNLVYGLASSRISVNRAATVVKRSDLIYLAGFFLERVVHPSPLVINFKRHKPDPTSLKHMLEPFVLVPSSK